MIQVDRALFSNVATSIQRTSNLPGGGVNGLPGGIVIRGLEGVGSFAADIQDAQKEFEKGRVRTSLERVRQLDSLFQSIMGRWSSSVNTVLSSARTGNQQLSMQKLNEVKNAQTKMQQLSRPTNKAFQDLITALEIAVTNEGRDDDPNETATEDVDLPSESAPAAKETVKAESLAAVSTQEKPQQEESNHPDSDLLGQYATNYRFGDKLAVKKGADGKARLTPAIESNKFYFVHALDPPRVVRVREIRRDEILVFDTLYGQETTIDTKLLKTLLREGIWRLQAKG